MARNGCAVHAKYFKFKHCLSGLTIQKTVDIEGIFFNQDLSTFVLNSKGLFSDGMRQGLHGNLLYRKADLPAGTAVLGKAGGLVLDSLCSELFPVESFSCLQFPLQLLFAGILLCPYQGGASFEV